MTRPKKNSNIIHTIFLLEYGFHKNTYLCGLECIRLLIKDPKAKFKQVPIGQLNQNVTYDDCQKKFWFHSSKQAKYIWGPKNKLVTLYEFPIGWKVFRDIVSISRPFPKVTSPRQDYSPSFFVLSKENQLIRFDNFSGKQYEKFYLGNTYKFMYIGWSVFGEQLVLQTSYNKKNDENDLLKAFCLVDIFPLKLRAVFELRKELFEGETITRANVSDGLLIVSSSKKNIQVYDLPELISDKNRICHCDFLQTRGDCKHGLIGNCPTDLRPTHRLDKLPTLLYEKKSAQEPLEFGRVPFHCLYKQLRGNNFLIEDIASEQIVCSIPAENRLEFNSNDTEMFFHWDDSGRIVHKKTNEVIVYKLIDNNPVEQFSLLLEPEYIRRVPPRYPRRCVQKTKIFSELHLLDFENELDYLVIFGTNNNLTSVGLIDIFENSTGKHIKRIHLDITIKDSCTYSLVMDMDTVIIIEDGKFTTYILMYQLDRSDEG